MLFYFSEHWLAKLRKDTLRSQRCAFARRTIKNFKSQWRKFLLFCEYSQNYVLPIDNDRLCLFIQFLSRSLKSPQSIHNYVSGLKTLHTLLDLPFPSLSCLDVKLTLKGIQKI